MIVLKTISRQSGGKRLAYEYEVQGRAKKYFDCSNSLFIEYDRNVDDVPDCVAVIPFLANILPIAWFVGFDVKVECCDSVFLNTIEEIRNVFERLYPGKLKQESHLLVRDRVEVPVTKAMRRSVMLFSGGVDAFATYFRHFDEELDLCTVFGADIDLADTRQISQLQEFNRGEGLIAGRDVMYVWANLRTFYTYHVELLLEQPGWWGSVQHGMALLSILAPISHLRGHSKAYIASSFCAEMGFLVWGSMPEIDNCMRWSGVESVHDGYELSRQDKVELIVSEMQARRAYSKLRVCYSELNNGLNCSNCEKCLRTIFGIIIEGGDPSRYGFEIGADLVERIKSVLGGEFKSPVAQMFWVNLAARVKKYHLDSPERLEMPTGLTNEQLFEVVDIVDRCASTPAKKKGGIDALKFRVRKMFPQFARIYMGTKKILRRGVR